MENDPSCLIEGGLKIVTTESEDSVILGITAREPFLLLKAHKLDSSTSASTREL
jgi:hypothetical protein